MLPFSRGLQGALGLAPMAPPQANNRNAKLKIDRTVVKSLPLFAKMNDAELDRLLDFATAKRVPQGEAVFEQGENAASFFLLLHGRLKVLQVTEDGQQIIVRMVHPGDLFG